MVVVQTYPIHPTSGHLIPPRQTLYHGTILSSVSVKTVPSKSGIQTVLTVFLFLIRLTPPTKKSPLTAKGLLNSWQSRARMTPGSLVHLLSGSQHRQLQAVRPVTNKSTQRIQPHKNLARNNKTNHLLLESLVVLEEEEKQD